ncbi:MAG: isopentenyl-diphosphate Delta-isomerase [Cytophagaceae bacterium]|nr:isopentenyl-diphosphate Delta-isomerase [Gemmatimonadaceae bacterium]
MIPSRDAVDVILVDDEDRPLGLCDKLEAHRRGLLHRAVSVFAFSADGRLWIQRRAAGKYHSSGLWSNSACTHPRDGEALDDAARRGVREELGIEVASLRYAFPIVYRADVGAALIEHEYDHVFTGEITGSVQPVAEEVDAVDLVSVDELVTAAATTPERYTPWFRLLIERVQALRAANP